MKVSISHSFSARLSFYILLITAFLFVTAITIVALSSHRLIKEEATKSANNILAATILEVEKVLNSVEVANKNIEWAVAENIDYPEYMYNISYRLVNRNDNIIGSSVAFEPNFYPGKYYFAPYSYRSEDNAILSKQLGNDKYDYLTMDWYQIPKLLKKPYWTEPYYDEGGGGYIVSTFSRPLINENGEVYAVLTCDISLEWLREYILSIKPYDNAYSILIGRGGSYIAHYLNGRILNETIFSIAMAEENPALAAIGKEMINGHSGVIDFHDKGNSSFVVYAPVSNGWSMAIVCPYKDVFQRMMEMNLILILVASFGLFLLFVLCLMTIHRLTRPLAQFSNSALSIAEGNFNTTLPNINSKDEMKQLHDSFEYMQHSLTNYISELKTTTAAKERFESELSIARDIQMSMVPKKFPPFPGNKDVDLFALLNPAKAVGGDLYDYIILDNKLYFTIGDVSGKGVPASLYMAITRSAFRYLAGLKLPPDKIMYEANNIVAQDNETNMFITIFIGVLDLETGELTFCNGGHNPQIIISPDGKPSYMEVKPNLAIGLFPDFPYQMQEITLERGSSIFLYTDGVSEAENIDKELFGEDRLINLFSSLDTNEPKNVISNVLSNVKAFTKDAEQNDDITMLSIIFKLKS